MDPIAQVALAVKEEVSDREVAQAVAVPELHHRLAVRAHFTHHPQTFDNQECHGPRVPGERKRRARRIIAVDRRTLPSERHAEVVDRVDEAMVRHQGTKRGVVVEEAVEARNLVIGIEPRVDFGARAGGGRLLRPTRLLLGARLRRTLGREPAQGPRPCLANCHRALAAAGAGQFTGAKPGRPAPDADNV